MAHEPSPFIVIVVPLMLQTLEGETL
jgi:hypothetical protein